MLLADCYTTDIQFDDVIVKQWMIFTVTLSQLCRSLLNSITHKVTNSFNT
jgi:hypothetical protein